MSMPPWIAKQIRPAQSNQQCIDDKVPVAASTSGSPAQDTTRVAIPQKTAAQDGFVAIGSQTMTFQEAAEKPSKLRFFRNIFKRK